MAQDEVKNEMEADRKVYELGYLLASSVTEDKLAGEVTALKGVIEKLGGSFISEEYPALMPLAYTVNLVRTGRREKYREAYFGSVKFELTPEATATLKESLEHLDHMVRYLLVVTVKEDTRAPKRLFQKSDAAPSGRPAARFADKEKAKTPVSEEELDRSLAGVVVE